MLENDAYCTDILIQFSTGLKFTVSLENKTVTVDGCEHCLKTALSEIEDLGFTPSV